MRKRQRKKNNKCKGWISREDLARYSFHAGKLRLMNPPAVVTHTDQDRQELTMRWCDREWEFSA